ncbi:MAG TPA: tRNA (adenosine(37)-N6)-threonylcarbamoyltransferase complex transferase subunit TsaD [Chitinispirillaceae bacterium]|nr:tRNA (adenosine(37)-N6)-threonylcarbamoyltransferase complex transferase subunit TsaD [Chitinispirillaceae bacterium]
MITLGIESSCDETSVAILRDTTVIKNGIYSQTEHSQFGGVVPEIASRAHLEKIDHLTESVFAETDINIKDIDLISVTDSPGLAGALLVGVSFALGLHTTLNKPITGINHLEGHIFSALLENPDLSFPFLALVVSGGHTAIYTVHDTGKYDLLGQTVDDAAGEAFDKVGKMLGFTYPAGRSIEHEASMVQNEKSITFPVARISSNNLNFSFSGLKTAVKYFIKDKNDQYINENRSRICFAFQKAVIDSLSNNLAIAVKSTKIRRIALVGGVACNQSLRQALQNKFGTDIRFPSPELCTDNAAMIALAGYNRYRKKQLRFPTMNPSAPL